MSKEVEFKYFLNGVKVEKAVIDWNRSLSIRPVNGDEVHITYMNIPSADRAEKIDLGGMQVKPNPYVGDAGIPKKETILEKGKREIMEALILKDSIIEEQRARGYYPYPSKEYKKAVENGLKGVKHNKHKAPLDIVQTRQFSKALQLVALATAFGNKKYEETDKDFLNFKRVAGGSQTYFDAAARHNTERNEIDEDSGLPHVIHAVWDMLAGLEILVEERGVDVKKLSKEYLENLHRSK